MEKENIRQYDYHQSSLIGNTEIKDILNNLKDNPQVKFLRIQDNQIDMKGFDYLCQYISENPNIDSIAISLNQLDYQDKINYLKKIINQTQLRYINFNGFAPLHNDDYCNLIDDFKKNYHIMYYFELDFYEFEHVRENEYLFDDIPKCYHYIKQIKKIFARNAIRKFFNQL